MNFGGRNHSDLAQSGLIIPFMIEEADLSVLRPALCERNVQPLTDGFLAHGLVRAQGDHHIQPRHRGAQDAVQRLKNHADRGCARAVRHDQ